MFWLHCIELQPASTETKGRIMLSSATPLCISVSSCFVLFTSPHSAHRLYPQLLMSRYVKVSGFLCLCSNFLARSLEMVVKCHRFCMHCVPFISCAWAHAYFTSVTLISQVWTRLKIIDSWLQMTNLKFITTWFQTETMYLRHTITLRFKR